MCNMVVALLDRGKGAWKQYIVSWAKIGRLMLQSTIAVISLKNAGSPLFAM